MAYLRAFSAERGNTFRELRQRELRRISLPRTPVNNAGVGVVGPVVVRSLGHGERKRKDGTRD